LDRWLRPVRGPHGCDRMTSHESSDPHPIVLRTIRIGQIYRRSIRLALLAFACLIRLRQT
ncbi:hypothetical protein J6590_105061, partial [Homalodisca vitripennis]